jgi:hypothetical protein
MTLLERYLCAIKTLLPAKTQDDIVNELSENILSQFEEKEAGLGRPLTEAEQAEVIKHHGHPVVVAARYRRPRHLIGPGVFPFYWLVLKITAISALIVRTILAIIMAVVSPNPSSAIVPALVAVPSVLIPVFFWVTVAFAAFEMCSSVLNVKLDRGWNPRSLPSDSGRLPFVPRTTSVARIVFGAAFILWWQSLPVAPQLVFGPAASTLALGQVWIVLHWPILLLAAAGVVQSAVDLSKPDLTHLRAGARLLTDAAGLVLLCLIIRAGSWVVIAPGVQNPAAYAGVVGVLNQVLFYGFIVGLVIAALQFAWECIKLFPELSFFRSGVLRPHIAGKSSRS